MHGINVTQKKNNVSHMPLLNLPRFKRTKCHKGSDAKHGRPRVITKVNGLPAPTKKIITEYAHVIHKKAIYLLGAIRRSVARHYLVRIKETPNKGKGAFNVGKKPIPAGKQVAWFSGTVVPADKPFPNNFYLMHLGNVRVGKRFVKLSIDGRSSLDINNSVNGSYYNHSCNPNCEVIRLFSELEISIPVIRTLRAINPGEELTIHYGDDYWHNPTTGSKVLKKNIPSDKMIKCLCSHPLECPNKYFLRSY